MTFFLTPIRALILLEPCRSERPSPRRRRRIKASTPRTPGYRANWLTVHAITQRLRREVRMNEPSSPWRRSYAARTCVSSSLNSATAQIRSGTPAPYTSAGCGGAATASSTRSSRRARSRAAATCAHDPCRQARSELVRLFGRPPSATFARRALASRLRSLLEMLGLTQRPDQRFEVPLTRDE